MSLLLTFTLTCVTSTETRVKSITHWCSHSVEINVSVVYFLLISLLCVCVCVCYWPNRVRKRVWKPRNTEKINPYYCWPTSPPKSSLLVNPAPPDRRGNSHTKFPQGAIHKLETNLTTPLIGEFPHSIYFPKGDSLNPWYVNVQKMKVRLRSSSLENV